MYVSNSNSIVATVKSIPSVKETKYGDKAVVEVMTVDGQTMQIFDTMDEFNDSPVLELKVGQVIDCYVNKFGNLKLVKASLQVAVKKSALSITPKTVINDDSVTAKAKLLRQCVDAVLTEFTGVDLSDDLIQKYATTLFISLNK